MSNPLGLASYVDKYILNPAQAAHPSVDNDEIGNEETRANIIDRIKGKEGSKYAFCTVSKLRQQNTEALGERDPRYKGKKTVRKNIQDARKVSFDPDLAKLCLIEDDNEEASSSGSCSDEESANEMKQEHLVNRKRSKTKQGSDHSDDISSDGNEDDFMRMGEEMDEGGSDDDDENDVGSDDDNDVGSDDSSIEEEDESDEESRPAVKTFSSEDSNQLLKGKCVKNQCTIYDSLFEARINLQKVASIANQLPQHDIFQDFLQNKNYPQYKVNLLNARKSVKKMMTELLDLQEYLLRHNSETRPFLSRMEEESEDREEVASSDEEADGAKKSRKSKKNKRKIEEFENTLTKRHKVLAPFRDQTLNKWHDKTKLLESQSKKNFSNFDIPPAKYIRNILANKDELVKRTRMSGVSRGNMYKIMGKSDKEETQSSGDHYDPEIFDDTDFYTRMLEDFLKSKMSHCDDMHEVSRRWISIQKLRKKVQTTMDPKGSKERTLKFHTMSKLQQFLAPCKPSLMEDDATNRLFSSLFGQSEKYIPDKVIVNKDI